MVSSLLFVLLIKNIIESKYKIKNEPFSFKHERVEELTPEQIGLLSNEIFLLINENY